MLITGFGAFDGVDDNPSAHLARALDPNAPVLPVEWRAVRDFLKDRRKEAILLLGVAPGRTEPTYELFAHNVAAERPDAAGHYYPLREIAPGAPKSLGATFLTPEELPRLKMATSYTPGAYLCDYALYLALLHSCAPRVGFVHVAPFAACPSEDQLASLRALIALLPSDRGDASSRSSTDAAMNSSIIISSPSGHISNGPDSVPELDPTRQVPAITVPSQTPR